MAERVPARFGRLDPSIYAAARAIASMKPARGNPAPPGLTMTTWSTTGKCNRDFPILGAWQLWIAFTGCQATPLTAGQRLTVKVQGQCTGKDVLDSPGFAATHAVTSVYAAPICLRNVSISK